MGVIHYKNEKYGGRDSTIIVPITRASYDVLTEEEKNLDVLYFITDEDTNRINQFSYTVLGTLED